MTPFVVTSATPTTTAFAWRATRSCPHNPETTVHAVCEAFEASGTWKARRWLVSSQWGWRLTDTQYTLPDPYLYDAPPVGTEMGGFQPR